MHPLFRLRTWWDQVQAHVFFLPSLLVVALSGAALVLLQVDEKYELDIATEVPWLFGGGVDGAREVLSTIAGSLVSLVGVSFSIVVVALALRSQQFGPRLLRNFTRDRANQVVIGTLIATVIYCLLVLRMVRGLEDDEFVPRLAVTGANVLALTSLGAFVFFIDRVLTSIQANTIIASVAEETRACIDRMFPEALPRDLETEEVGELPEADLVAICARETGYIQAIDIDRLVALACDTNARVRMEVPVGAFVIDGAPLAMVAAPQAIPEAMKERIRGTFEIGEHRSVTEDPEFGIQQLVDVAVKALSPSVNDPSTAITCVDHLGAVLATYAERVILQRVRRDESGTVRLLSRGPTFDGAVALALNQIRQNARCDVAVTMRLLEMISAVARVTRDTSQRKVLLSHVRMIARGADAAITEAADRQDINDRLLTAARALQQDHTGAVSLLLPLGRHA